MTKEEQLEQWKLDITEGDESLDAYAIYALRLGVDRKTAKTKILQEIFNTHD